MKIGVISDTHLKSMPEEARELFERLSKEVDFLLHAGDLGKLDFYIELKDIFKDSLYAVRGNMDIEPLATDLPEVFKKDFDGITISMTHSYGAPADAKKNAWNTLKSTKPDIVIYGHSHHPYNKYEDKVLFFNPGSLFDEDYAPYTSYGIIEIEKGKIIDSEIIRVNW